MKLISWNVNGLRAAVKKGFADQFATLDADIFCLQETKLQQGQIDLPLPGYRQYWSYAEKKGYAGTAIFTKRAPLAVTYGLGPGPRWGGADHHAGVSAVLLRDLLYAQRPGWAAAAGFPDAVG